MTERIFITGANRGIGLGIVRDYLENTEARIVATCRAPHDAHDLQALQAQAPQRLHILPLEVTDDRALAKLQQAVSQHLLGIDLLINNAGINGTAGDGTRPLAELQRAALLNMINVNAVSAVLVVQALLPLLKAGTRPRIVMISSQMGSLDYLKNSSNYGYAMSKAAMNMGARVLASELKAHGIISITTHPGWVQTDMGGTQAPLTVAESARGLRAVFDRLTMDDNGAFYNWDGSTHAW